MVTRAEKLQTAVRVRSVRRACAFLAGLLWGLLPLVVSAQPTVPPDAPGGPILVVTDAANPFTGYYAEILRAEGFNAFDVQDIALVDAGLLAGFDVVIVGEMPLDATQVGVLETWVTAGGNLIVMRPDRSEPTLLTLLGLTDAGGTLEWPERRYLLIDTTSTPGAGLVSETIQFHGGADLYDLAGATQLAELYSDATTSAGHPAVVWREVGPNDGHVAAFTYDLARSVVLTRQGNPAWSGQERDGDGRVRSNDAFVGDTPGVDDWIDLDKVHIPQADMQQSLLANLILEMNRDQMPLPRFWYFPNGFKAVLVMTMDSHGGSGYTLTRMQEHVDQSPPGCSLDNWECVRATNYLYTSDAITDAEALTWNDLGFEFALHVDTGCNSPWADIDALRGIYDAQHPPFRTKYASIPYSISERGHCVTWADWASKPIVQNEWGVRIDCTYYYEAVGAWAINSHPGMYTGSGLSMRFADLDGSLIDVFQLTTQMTDESGQSYPFTVDAILDKAVGAEGYYGAFCANMHSDNPPPWNGSIAAPQIVASAQDRGVPVIAARQMLAWLDGRDAAHFAALAWDEGTGTLSFTVVEDISTLTLEAMLPVIAGSGELTEIERDGGPIAYRTETIRGVTYAIFSAEAGDYSVTYEPDLTAPVIADVSHDVQQGGVTRITWLTDELADSRVDYGTDPGDLAVAATDALLVTDHTIVLSSLAPITTYHYTVTSEDAWGNAATEPTSGTYSFTTPAAVCFLDDTAADFAAGDPGLDTYVADVENGEVILAPAAGSEFGGTALPSGWETAEADPGGSVVVAGGILTVDGYRVSTEDFFAAPTGAEVRSLEFVATFGAAQHQHLGFGNTLQEYPYAIFSTSSSGNALYAHTRVDAATGLSELLSAGYLGAPHRFRIDWRADGVDYYIDGALVTSHAYALTDALRPVIFERYTGAPQLTVDWLRMSPYSGAGQFESRVYDAGATADWDMMTWLTDLPAGTTVDLYTRTGDTPEPDVTWTSYTPVPVSGTILGTTSQFIQYQAQLTTDDPNQTPALAQVAISCDAGEDLTPPFILNLVATPDAGGTTATITWDTNELSDSMVAFGTAPDLLDQTVSDAAFVTAHNVPLDGLSAGTTYYYRATSADAATNSRTEPPVEQPAASFTTPTPPAPACFVDTADADFALGDFGTDTALAIVDDGEVILAPTVGEDFAGDTLPPDWEEWDSGGTTVVSGGLLILDGMRAGTTALFDAPLGSDVRTIEFVATFQNVQNQHGGLGVAYGTEYQWAMFSTQGGGALNARTRNGDDFEDHSLGSSYFGAEHDYRIDWSVDGVDFYIDGAPVHSSAVSPVDPLRPLMNDSNENDAIYFTVDWVRLSPYSPAGSFTSRVYDSQGITDWEQALWLSDEPAGTALALYVRSGDEPDPDGATWTAFTLVPNNGDIIGTTSRFVQYRADLATTDPSVTPALAEMTVTCFAGEDDIPPWITAIDAVVGPTGTTATVSWLTDEPADSRVDYGTDPDHLLISASDAAMTTDHEIELLGLAVATTYYYQVTSADASDNASTEPAIPASFTTPAPCTGDATAVDFLAGETTDTYIAETNDGEIMLAPADGAEFFGSDIPAGTWEWITRGGSYAVADGVVTIDGGSIGSTTRRSVGRAMEFVVTYTNAVQHIGFGEAFNGPDFAIFTCDGSQLNARTLSSAGNMVTPLGASYLNAPHLFRIEWNATTVDYYIDGDPTPVATHSHTHAADLRFLAMDSNAGGGVLILDWARISPLTPAGTFVSRVIDSGEESEWLDLQWAGDVPAATSVDFETRSGNIADPDGSWSGWEAVAAGDVVSPDAQYLQYRASLTSGDTEITPVVTDVQVCHLPADPCSGDTEAPAAITELTAAKVLLDNEPGQTVQVVLNWPEVEAAATVHLYRKGFGNYPEYDDEPDAGAPPTIPADPDAAQAAGWTPVGDVVDLTVHNDLYGERDFWYYVAFCEDACGNVSGPSNLTAGVPNYHLGDVYDGATPGVGDNIVTTNDVTRLALGYGTLHGDADYRNFLDVGPVAPSGLPATDNMIQFEDLVIFAINFHSVGKELTAPPVAAENRLRIEPAAPPSVGETYTVALTMAGDGRIQGLSVPIEWDAAVLELLGATAGELLAQQGGDNLVLSPEPGLLDIVLIGVRERGISGEGVLAELRFRVLAEGDPAFALGTIDARSPANAAVALEGEVGRAIPRVTSLHPNAPNPFNPRTRIAFDLAVGGEVAVEIYGVDGRLVRTLVREHHEPGYYTLDWNGTDDHGRRLASGVYMLRLVTPEKTQVRKMMLMK